MVVDPFGRVVAEVKGVGNEICTATIPIAEFRTEQNRFDEYHNPHMAAGALRGRAHGSRFVGEVGRETR